MIAVLVRLLLNIVFCHRSTIVTTIIGDQSKKFDGYRKDNRRVLFARNVRQRLQVAKLESNRRLLYGVGGLFESDGCVLFASGSYNFGASLSSGLGLRGHGSLQLNGQTDIFPGKKELN